MLGRYFTHSAISRDSGRFNSSDSFIGGSIGMFGNAGVKPVIGSRFVGDMTPAGSSDRGFSAFNSETNQDYCRATSVPDVSNDNTDVNLPHCDAETLGRRYCASTILGAAFRSSGRRGTPSRYVSPVGITAPSSRIRMAATKKTSYITAIQVNTQEIGTYIRLQELAETRLKLRPLCPLNSKGNLWFLSCRCSRCTCEHLESVATSLIELDDNTQDEAGVVLPMEGAGVEHRA